MKNGINRPISTKKWPPNRQNSQNQKSEKNVRAYWAMLLAVLLSERFARGLLRYRSGQTTDDDDVRRTTTQTNRLPDLWSVNLKIPLDFRQAIASGEFCMLKWHLGPTIVWRMADSEGGVKSRVLSLCQNGTRQNVGNRRGWRFNGGQIIEGAVYL